MREGEADIHSGLFKTREREEWLRFSLPLQNIKTGLYARANAEGVASLSSLAGRRVGAVKGTYQAQYLKANHPDVVTVEVDSSDDYFFSLLRGDLDAFIDEVPSVEANLARLGLIGVIVRQQELFSNLMYAGVRLSDPELLQLVVSGLEKIPREKKAEIEALWIANPEDRFFALEEGVVHLTASEKSWLEEHPVLPFAVTTFIRPVDIVDNEGNYRGLNADLISLLNKKLGANIVPEFFDSWNALVESVLAGEVDAAFSFSRTPEREKSVLFTQPYAYDPIIVVVRQGEETIKSWRDLGGHGVVAVSGMSVVEELREAIGEGELVLVESDGDAARMLAEGSVRAYVSFMLPYRNAQMTAFVPGLAIADQRNTEGGSLRIAIHKSQPMLAQIMTKAIDALTPAELASLRDRWLVPKPSRDAGASLRGELSAKELAWLDAHPVVRLGDDFAWPPFTFMDDDDNFAGIASGYAAAISGRLGIELRPVRNLSWPEVIEQVKTGDLDVLPAVARTKMREAFLNFTQPYVSFPVVIATRKDAPLVDRLDDLEGWTVGVVEGYVTDELLAENHSGLNRKRVTSVAEGLRALEDNEITAFVGNLGAITYEIERARLEDIRIAAPTDYRSSFRSGFARTGRNWWRCSTRRSTALTRGNDRRSGTPGWRSR